MERHLVATGNQAPPWPATPLALSLSTRSAPADCTGEGPQRARWSSTPTGAASAVSPLSNRGTAVASGAGAGLAVSGVLIVRRPFPRPSRSVSRWSDQGPAAYSDLPIHWAH